MHYLLNYRLETRITCVPYCQYNVMSLYTHRTFTAATYAFGTPVRVQCEAIFAFQLALEGWAERRRRLTHGLAILLGREPVAVPAAPLAERLAHVPSIVVVPSHERRKTRTSPRRQTTHPLVNCDNIYTHHVFPY